jgi:hypothetical protein
MLSSISHFHENNVYEMAIVQHTSNANGGVLAGGNFNQDSRDVTNASMWAQSQN